MKKGKEQIIENIDDSSLFIYLAFHWKEVTVLHHGKTLNKTYLWEQRIGNKSMLTLPEEHWNLKKARWLAAEDFVGQGKLGTAHCIRHFQLFSTLFMLFVWWEEGTNVSWFNMRLKKKAAILVLVYLFYVFYVWITLTAFRLLEECPSQIFRLSFILTALTKDMDPCSAMYWSRGLSQNFVYLRNKF